jgi:hypothetical protein
MGAIMACGLARKHDIALTASDIRVNVRDAVSHEILQVSFGGEYLLGPRPAGRAGWAATNSKNSSLGIDTLQEEREERSLKEMADSEASVTHVLVADVHRVSILGALRHCGRRPGRETGAARGSLRICS